MKYEIKKRDSLNYHTLTDEQEKPAVCSLLSSSSVSSETETGVCCFG